MKFAIFITKKPKILSLELELHITLQDSTNHVRPSVRLSSGSNKLCFVEYTIFSK